MVSLPPTTDYNCIIETPDGLVLRVPVLRIDNQEALLDTPFTIPPQDGFEVIFERSDGHAEVLHTSIRSSGIGGLTLRWDYRHPAEMTAVDRLLEPPSRLPLSGGRDLPLDIERALKSRARVVRTSKIAEQQDSIRVLKLDTIKELIETAVDEAIERAELRLEAGDRTRVLEDSEKRFRELLAQEKAEKEDIEAQRTRLQSQLERAHLQLQREREREIAGERFTLSDKGLGEIEDRIGRYLNSALEQGKSSPNLEAELRGTVEGLLDAERDRIGQLSQAASSDRIKLLEQKIHRLSRSLSDTQSERDAARERASALESTHGGAPLKNVHQPGISSEDPTKGRKLALLADLVRENHELRRQMESDGRGKSRLKVDDAAGPVPNRPEKR